jgi:hypothetical protein
MLRSAARAVMSISAHTVPTLGVGILISMPTAGLAGAAIRRTADEMTTDATVMSAKILVISFNRFGVTIAKGVLSSNTIVSDLLTLSLPESRRAFGGGGRERAGDWVVDAREHAGDCRRGAHGHVN